MTDPAEKKTTGAAAARNVAVKRLIEKHKDEFNALYDEEAAARGIQTRASRVEARKQKLAAELRALGVDVQL